MSTIEMIEPAAESATTNDIALVQATIVEFDRVAAGIADLKAKYGNVAYDCATTSGMNEAVIARRTIREPRYAVDKALKDAKRPLNDLKRNITERADQITAQLLEIEVPIHEQILAAEAKKEAERAERARIEAERKAAHQRNIGAIRGYLPYAQNLPSERIQAGITNLEAMAFGPEWEEFAVEALAARTETVDAMRSLFATVKAREDEAARMEAERQDLARRQAEQAERERVAKEEQERAAAALAEQQRQLAEQQRKLEEQAAALKLQEQTMRDLEAARTRLLEQEEQRGTPDSPAPMQFAPAVVEVLGTIPSPAANLVTLPGCGVVGVEDKPAEQPAAAPAPAKLITLGTICERLGVTVTAAWLTHLGVAHAGREKNAYLYREDQFQKAVAALIASFQDAAEKYRV